MKSKSYQLLGVSENASYEEIKTAFRNAILKKHPDINKGHSNSETSELIDAYKTLIDKSNKTTVSNLELYSPDEVTDTREKAVSKVLLALSNLKAIFYPGLKKKKNIYICTHHLVFLNKIIDNTLDEEQITGSLKILFTSLYDLERIRQDNYINNSAADYTLDIYRRDVFDYFDNVFRASDYLTIRHFIHAHSERLIRDTMFQINKVSSPGLKEELFCIMMILLIISDDFFSEWLTGFLLDRSS